MAETISHMGKVTEVTETAVTVEIVSRSACSSCSASGLCSMSEAVRKQVRVPAVPGETYEVGEEVEVCLAPSAGMKAVVTAYVIPLFILLILCVSLSYSGLNELIAGLAGICGVALYYLVIHLTGGRSARKYAFYIRKNNINS